MHARGPDRSRLLPILIAFAGLFAAAGCVAPARMPESPPFAVAPADISDRVGSLGAAGDHPAQPPVEVDVNVVSEQAPPEALVAINDEARLLRYPSAAPSLALARASGPSAAWAGRSTGAWIGPGTGRWHVATLQFARGSASLAREEYIILRAIAALRARQGGRIEVVGHADHGRERGVVARRVNRLVADRRAAAIAAALVAFGLPPAAVVAEGRGDSEPLYAEVDAVGAAGNRRAKIYLLPSDIQPVAAPESDRGSEVDASTEAKSVPARAVEEASTEPESTREEPVVGAIPAVEPENGPTGGGAPAIVADRDRVPVATLYFPHASSRLGERERAIIEAVAVFQRHRGDIVVVGHASAAGAARGDPQRLEQANRSISLARADAVATRLAAFGVAADTMSIVGKGADEPACIEGDAVGEAANRRVEIYVDLPAAGSLADREPSLPS